VILGRWGGDVDDRDEYGPEAEAPLEPVTERVRIIGAQPAGAAAGQDVHGDDTASPQVPAEGRGTPPAGRDAEVPRAPAFDLFSEEPEAAEEPEEPEEPGIAVRAVVPTAEGHDEEAGRSAPSGRNGGDPLEPGSDVLKLSEPNAVVPDMPHWTDPPPGRSLPSSTGAPRRTAPRPNGPPPATRDRLGASTATSGTTAASTRRSSPTTRRE